MNKEEFLKIKEAYKSARTEERKSIIGFITKKKDKEGNFLFTKSKDKPYTTRNQYSGGGGNKKYTSGSRLSRPYDLSNHMWIDLSYKGNDILISLQSFDIDPNSKELHVLYDRIGIMFEKDGKILLPDNKSEVSDAFLKMETTNWELPLSEADMEEMVNYIINHYEE
ncbi:TPA: hypothetical protein VU078_000209 [Streptococcus pneumoniae]|nr:hypothetical protein [Streptococcus pneumoniae]VFH50515.1 Uncharacterised protein [Streptococcus pneumoniae]VIV39099.1 Uncharacterised protein [Streptococcus pneumoniae]VIZ85595.1 Uncharacterised protein [Streptococcus pneumoniae]VJE47263.1 Uncharacterised protein [Streptococcus pneumoniae]VJQ65251.1 Uncharacterised protein [Streptococcus pneumoniae]